MAEVGIIFYTEYDMDELELDELCIKVADFYDDEVNHIVVYVCVDGEENGEVTVDIIVLTVNEVAAEALLEDPCEIWDCMLSGWYIFEPEPY